MIYSNGDFNSLKKTHTQKQFKYIYYLAMLSEFLLLMFILENLFKFNNKVFL